jgi:hypothetical protein
MATVDTPAIVAQRSPSGNHRMPDAMNCEDVQVMVFEASKLEHMALPYSGPCQRAQAPSGEKLVNR